MLSKAEKGFTKDNYQDLYASISNREKQLNGELINFEKTYPNVLKESNLDDIIKHLKTRKQM